MSERTRRQQYMDVYRLFPDEIVGATDIECEDDIRGVSKSPYGIQAPTGYCTQLTVARCSECSLSNYNRDCHNNPIALDNQ